MDLKAQTEVYHRRLAEFGVVVMDAVPGQKRTKRGWGYYDNLHQERGRSRLDMVPRWLQEGGAMFRPAGGLWVLDCDDQDTIQETEAYLKSRSLKCPQVSTPSGGRHFIFRLPDSMPVSDLKNHVNRAGGAKWDFKLGERTALMLVGSVRPKGAYLPHTPWADPPAVDPRELEPSIKVFTEKTPFLTYERPGPAARFAALGYLRNPHTPVSKAGEGGRKILAMVACNLIRYYCQEPQNALAMLMRNDANGRNWNQRCRYPDGTPYPWSEQELYEALVDAQDGVPSLGVTRYKQEEWRAEVVQKLAEHVLEIKRQLSADSNCQGEPKRVQTSKLYWAFLEQNGWNHDSVKERPIDLKAYSRALMDAGLKIGRNQGRSVVIGPKPFGYTPHGPAAL